MWRLLQPPIALFLHLWVRVEATGLEHIDNGRGGLFVMNHQTFLDPLLVAVLLHRPVSFLARDSLFRVPLLGWLLRQTWVIPISRESVRGGSIRAAVERMESGFLVGIFPEGTRSSGESVKAFRPGFLAIVRRTGQPVYPVAIAGADRILPRGAWFVRPGRVRIAYGCPLLPGEIDQLLNSGDERVQAEAMRQRVATLFDEALTRLRPPLDADGATEERGQEQS